MKIPKKVVDPLLWKEATDKLLAGVWGRKEAAAHVGLPYSTFCKHLEYEKLTPVIAKLGLDGNAGANSWRAKEDLERHQRYLDAVDMAVKSGSISTAAAKFDVNYQVLARKVRAAREQHSAATPT